MSTSETVYDRWYILPSEETTGPDGNPPGIAPKYAHDDPDIDGYSGQTVSPDVIDDNYAALVQTYPDVNPWYIVRLYGTGNAGWQALNDISVLGDTRNLATNAQDVDYILDTHFPELPSDMNWSDEFFIGV